MSDITKIMNNHLFIIVKKILCFYIAVHVILIDIKIFSNIIILENEYY